MGIGVKSGLNSMDDTDKPSKINGFKACYVVKYGLKAARRAPQFSKR